MNRTPSILSNATSQYNSLKTSFKSIRINQCKSVVNQCSQQLTNLIKIDFISTNLRCSSPPAETIIENLPESNILVSNILKLEEIMIIHFKLNLNPNPNLPNHHTRQSVARRTPSISRARVWAWATSLAAPRMGTVISIVDKL